MDIHQGASTAQTSSGITLYEGDLFAHAPTRSVLVHACNTQGSWGSGIAALFKKKYPAAYQVYHDTCVEKGDNLLGTCLLIPTGERDIACLFTSKGYGRNVDGKSMILRSTRTAAQDLMRQTQGSDKPIYGW
jgi:ADP-ribose 1''-phosphate phosphatase